MKLTNNNSDRDSKIEIEMINYLAEKSRDTIWIPFLIVTVCFLVLNQYVSTMLLVIWSGAIFLLTVIRVILTRQFFKKNFGQIEKIKWFKSFFIVITLYAAALGSMAFFIYVDNSLEYENFIVFVLGGLTAGGIISFSSKPSLAITYILLLDSPLMILFIMKGDLIHINMAILTLAFIFFMATSSKKMNKMAKTTFRLRFENEDLITTLMNRNHEYEEINNELLKEIEEKQKVSVDLEESEEKFRQIASNIPGLVYQFKLSTDKSYSFTYISQGVYQLFNLTSKDVDLDPDILFRLTINPNFDSSQFAITDWVKTLKKWTGYFKIYTLKGKTKWIQGASSTNLQSDSTVIWNGILIDITDRERISVDSADDESKIIKKISIQKTFIEEKLNADIKNYLSGILISSHLIAKKIFDTRQLNLIKVIEKNINTLIAQSEKYFTYYKVLENRYILDYSKINLISILNTIIKNIFDKDSISDVNVILFFNGRNAAWDEKVNIHSDKKIVEYILFSIIHLTKAITNSDTAFHVFIEAKDNYLEIHFLLKVNQYSEKLSCLDRLNKDYEFEHEDLYYLMIQPCLTLLSGSVEYFELEKKFYEIIIYLPNNMKSI